MQSRETHIPEFAGRIMEEHDNMVSFEMCMMISRISVFLNKDIDTLSMDVYAWILPDGSEIVIDMDRKEIRFIDYVGDDKTYFAIVGLAHSQGFTTGDYDSEEDS